MDRKAAEDLPWGCLHTCAVGWGWSGVLSFLEARTCTLSTSLLEQKTMVLKDYIIPFGHQKPGPDQMGRITVKAKKKRCQ